MLCLFFIYVISVKEQKKKKKRIDIAFMDTLFFFKVFHLLEVQDYTADEDSDPL